MNFILLIQLFPQLVLNYAFKIDLTKSILVKAFRRILGDCDCFRYKDGRIFPYKGSYYSNAFTDEQIWKFISEKLNLQDKA